MSKKKINREDHEETYWEWNIALENGDTNLNYSSWLLSMALDPIIKIWNDTLGNIYLQRRMKID